MRILLVDDDPRLRRELPEHIADFIENTEFVFAASVTEAIQAFRENIGRLHAVVLDHYLGSRITSIPVYIEIHEQDPSFAETRVASHSSSGRSAIEKDYKLCRVEPPKIFIQKGNLKQILSFLNELPPVGDGEKITQK